MPNWWPLRDLNPAIPAWKADVLNQLDQGAMPSQRLLDAGKRHPYSQRRATAPFVFKRPVKTWGTSPPNFRATSFFLHLCRVGNKQPSLLWVFQSHSTHHYCSVGKHRTADPLAWMVRVLHSALCVMGKWWLLVAYEPPPPAWEAGDFPLSKQP